MEERDLKRWMLTGFLVFLVSTPELCERVIQGGLLGVTHSTLLEQSSRFGMGITQALSIPICLAIMCFSMDALNLGLKRYSLGGWGALGFASACFIAQGVVLLVAIQILVPLVCGLVLTPWLIRRAFRSGVHNSVPLSGSQP